MLTCRYSVTHDRGLLVVTHPLLSLLQLMTVRTVRDALVAFAAERD